MFSGLTDALKGLGAPVRALLVAMLGAWWAWLWFSGDRWWVALIAAGAARRPDRRWDRPKRAAEQATPCGVPHGVVDRRTHGAGCAGSGAADGSDSRVSDRIRDRFYATYRTAFRAGSVADLFVYSAHHGGADGWGRAARRVRADGIKDRWELDRAQTETSH
jgi:hypothetical protein